MTKRVKRLDTIDRMSPPPRETFYAHTTDGPQDEWERLSEHEALVSKFTESFLRRINPDFADWGSLLGKWHDIGKYSNEFQAYLESANSIDVHQSEVLGRVDHSTAAAQLANGKPSPFGKLIAYIFAGHHAGLPDWDVDTGRAGLKQRLSNDQIPRWFDYAKKELIEMELPERLPIQRLHTSESKQLRRAIGAFRVSFLARMMFSALVDADFLATESFMAPTQSDSRLIAKSTMSDLKSCLDQHIENLQSAATQSVVNDLRREVGQSCVVAADLSPGVFELNVPTGGGKTIASMQFALNHATRHGLEGVVVAIPFTSIIEQNAKVYRDIFDVESEQIVIEHHSNLDPEKETTTSRLQTENWDAPIVVTTNNQFFESMFASRTSRCRKVHRIAKRVIILDEVQSLPVELLTPTLFAIRELVESLGCTVILCTATQPSLHFQEQFPIGLHGIRSIVPREARLHERLRRTQVHNAGTLSQRDVVKRVEAEQQVLCIVNTRRDAANIFAQLRQKAGNFHLSTRMCAAHRLQVLDLEIRPRLASSRTCRVISTQLIEAGVDVDFPTVYRAICGLDSLTQAAGRCNREGKQESGEVYLFETEDLPPAGSLRMAAVHGREIFGQHSDPLSPEAMKDFFDLHYWKQSDQWDKHLVMDAIGRDPNSMEFQFRQIAERYQFINDSGEPLIVPWGDGIELVKLLEDLHKPPDRMLLRKLQRYTINLRRNELIRLQSAGAVELRHDRFVLTQPHLYHDRLGLVVDEADGVLPPDDLIF